MNFSSSVGLKPRRPASGKVWRSKAVSWLDDAHHCWNCDERIRGLVLKLTEAEIRIRNKTHTPRPRTGCQLEPNGSTASSWRRAIM
jgi:hypothetical protein